MNEPGIHNNQTPDYSEASAQLAAARMEEIIQTPEWAELKRDYQAGKVTEGNLKFIIDEIGHGRTVSEARGLLGFWNTERIVTDAKRAMPGLKKFARDPGGTIQQQAETWLEQAPGRLEEGSVLKHLGHVGTFGLLAYDLSVGSVLAMVQAGAGIVEGRGTAADILDVGSVASPFIRTGRFALGIRSIARQMAAQGAGLGKPRNILIPKKWLNQAMADPRYGAEIKRLVKELEDSGKIWHTMEIIGEVTNLALQNDELLLELLGAIGVQGTQAAFQKLITPALRAGDLAASGMEQGMAAAGAELAREQGPETVVPETEQEQEQEATEVPEQTNPLEMSLEEILQAVEDTKQQEEADLLQAAGGTPEGVARLQALIKEGNDEAIVAEFGEDANTPGTELFKLIYGDKESPILTTDDWREIERAISDVVSIQEDIEANLTGQGIDVGIEVLARSIMNLTPEQAEAAKTAQGLDIGQNITQIADGIKIKEITRILNEQGIESQAIYQRVHEYIVSQGVDPQEAHDLFLAPWFEGIESEATQTTGIQPPPEPQITNPLDMEYQDIVNAVEQGQEGFEALEQTVIEINAVREDMDIEGPYPGIVAITDAMRKVPKHRLEQAQNLQGEDVANRIDEIAEIIKIREILNILNEQDLDIYANSLQRLVRLGIDVKDAHDNLLQPWFPNIDPKDAKIQPPNIPTPVPAQQMDIEGTQKAVGASITFNIPSQPEIEIKAIKDVDRWHIEFSIPGFKTKRFSYYSKKPMTQSNAMRIISSIVNWDYRKAEWELDISDPRLQAERDPMTDEELQLKLEVPLGVKYLTSGKKAFKDIVTGNTNGIGFTMPMLDPAMRLKTRYQGDGMFDVYIESDGLAEYLEQYGANAWGKQFEFNYLPKDGKQRATLVLRNVWSADALGATYRALTNVIPTEVWRAIEAVGDGEAWGPQSLPQPLPGRVQVGTITEGQTYLFDEAGNAIDGYQINAADMGEGRYAVEVSFPDHADVKPVSVEVKSNSMQEAIVHGLQRLRAYNLGEGGIGYVEIETTVASEASESIYVEEYPEIIPSTEKSFGRLKLDKSAMKAAGMPLSGKGARVRIYQFSGRHAPEVRVERLGASWQDGNYEIELRHEGRNSAVAVIRNEPDVKKAIQQAIQEIEASGHEWRPMHKPGIFFQVDEVQNALKRLQLPTDEIVERRLGGLFHNLKTGSVDLRGYVVSSMKELAALGQVMRHPGFESQHVILLDADRRILDVLTYSYGVPAEAPAFPVDKVRDEMRRQGAKYIVDLHNHPSGRTEPSGESGDIGSTKAVAAEFSSQFLGMVIIDSGEFSYGKRNEATGEIDWHKRLKFRPTELGWDTEAEATDADFKVAPNIRPKDPLYQYDLEGPKGEFLKLQSGIARYQEGIRIRKIAQLGKYLNNTENTATLVFSDYAGQIIEFHHYTDLHLLSAEELKLYIQTEARKYGGVNVDAYVSEGDWYNNLNDVRKSAWGQLIAGDNVETADLFESENKKKTEKGVLRFSWFAGLQADELTDQGVTTWGTERELLDRYAYYNKQSSKQISTTITGALAKSQTDAEAGMNTGLTQPSNEQQAFIKRIENAIEKGEQVDLEKEYQSIVKALPNQLQIQKRRATELGVLSFAQGIINKFYLSKRINPQVTEPQAASDAFDELSKVDDNVFYYKVMPALAERDRVELSAQHAYLMARMANIGARDRVLTLDDRDGTLATFARNSGARSVETAATDAFVVSLFKELMPDAVDNIHSVEASNLARLYEGKRPTVILINPIGDVGKKIDEALKILAPGGRLVLGGKRFAKGSIETLSDKYRAQEVVESGVTYYVFDKVDSAVGGVHPWYSQILDATTQHSKESETQQVRNARQPVVDADIDVEYTGITPSEQTFIQPISPPLLSQPDAGVGQPVSATAANTGVTDTGEEVGGLGATPGVGEDVGGVEPTGEGLGVADESAGVLGESAPEAGAPVVGDESGGLGVGEGGVVAGEDVGAAMEGEPTDAGVSAEGGQVAGTATPSAPDALDSGLLRLATSDDVRAGERESRVSIEQDEMGNPVQRVTQRAEPEPMPSAKGEPEEGVEVDAEGVPLYFRQPGQKLGKVKWWRPEEMYHYGLNTAITTLEKMGTPGIKIATSLIVSRKDANAKSARFDALLKKHHKGWKKYIKQYVKQNKVSYKDATVELNDLMVRYAEGRTTTEVPGIIKRIVDEVQGFLYEEFAAPIMDMNKSIIRQGFIFEMPETLVDDGVLTNEFREGLEAPLPTFKAFMQKAGMEVDKMGVIQGVVQHKQSGKVFAIRVKGNVFVDVASGAIHPMKKGMKYQIVSPLGEVFEVDGEILKWDNPDYELIGYRNPATSKWEGDRNAAAAAWDAEISNSPRPDILREYFEQLGFELPEGVRFKFQKKGNLDEWSVRNKEGAEIYRIRRLVPTIRKGQDPIEAHEVYNPFKNKLMVYEGGAWRDPIFIKEGRTRLKLWEPTDNYFPHMVDWRNLSPNPDDGWRYQRFMEYADAMANIEENNFLNKEEAAEVLKHHYGESKTVSYGHLEQARQFFFPNYRRDFFNVMAAYGSKASLRLEVMREFGQDNDLLNAMLHEFMTEEGVTADLKPGEQAVLKIRAAKGYFDFSDEGASEGASPFIDDNGNPIGFDSTNDAYSKLSAADWQSLVDAELMTRQPDGTYIPTDEGIVALQNPSFLVGRSYSGMRKAMAAKDVVIRQLGWQQGELLDEEFGRRVNRFRTFIGAVLMPRSWASNIAQSANTAAAMGGVRTVRSMFSMFSKLERDLIDDLGVLAIDTMHEFGGGESLPHRIMQQQLGATAPFQTGRFHPIKSLFPKREWVEDIGIQTIPWSPFFAIERFNRRVSGRTAKMMAVHHLKKIVKDHGRIKSSTAYLTEMAHGYDLTPKLKAALETPNLTAAEIDMVSKMLTSEVREKAPHLWHVHEFIRSYAKHSADYLQHRVESMDRARVTTGNPFVNFVFMLRSFDFGQAKYQKNQFRREWKIMHEILNERNPVKAMNRPAVAAALGTMRYLPRLLMYHGPIMGIPAAVIYNVARFKVPGEDDMNLWAWMVRTGTFGAWHDVAEIAFGSKHKWGRYRSAANLVFGPGATTIVDLIATKGESGLSLIKGPIGPSAREILKMAAKGQKKPKITIEEEGNMGIDNILGEDDTLGVENILGQ